MNARLPAMLRRAALAAFAAALLAIPAFAEDPGEPLPEPLYCGAATLHAEASTEAGTIIHTASFDPLWMESLFEAGCVQAQLGCNTCSVTESGKTICGAASCSMTAPTTVAASCGWWIADFKCRKWRDSPARQDGGFAEAATPRLPTIVQAD